MSILHEIVNGNAHPGDAAAVSASIHRVFCIDCSYSMSASLPDMRVQLQNKLASSLSPGDYMTLIWFSGRGEYGAIFEHFSVKDVLDLSRVHASIQQYLRPIGSTGFVEPIRLARELVDKYGETAQVYFLTDGGENSWPREQCVEAFGRMNNVSVVMVEYGYACDRNFIRSLTEACDGVSIFHEDFPSFQEGLEKYMHNNVAPTRRQIATEAPMVVYLDPTNGDVAYRSTVNGVVSLPCNVHEMYEWNPNGSMEELSTTREKYIALYAAILMRCNDMIPRQLASIGDKFVSKLYASTFTKQDYSRMMEHLRGCIHQPDQFAFREGIDHDFVPVDDMFNVLELLRVLQADSHARFHPYHSDFKYTRMSASSVHAREDEKDGMFIPNRDLGSSIKLVFHSSRANVSIQCSVLGHRLRDDAIVPDSIFRTFNVIKDGIKHLTTLPVSLSEDTFARLTAEGCIAAGTVYKKNEVYILDLTHLPVVNRKFVSNVGGSADTFARQQVRLLYLKAAQKYVKRMMANAAAGDAEEKEPSSSASSTSRASSSSSSGVRDFYMAPELQVKIAKCSSIPAVNEKVLAKLSTHGALTLSESLFVPIHGECAAHLGDLEWLSTHLKSIGKEIGDLALTMEQTKMAFLLGGVMQEGVHVVVEEEGHSFEVTLQIEDVKVYME